MDIGISIFYHMLVYIPLISARGEVALINAPQFKATTSSIRGVCSVVRD
jgi:hypothetical protein